MAIFKKILILICIGALTAFLLYGSLVFGETRNKETRIVSKYTIKTSAASITVDPKGVENLKYSPYKSGSTFTGVLALDFGRLSTAFVIANPALNISFSGEYNLKFENLQGIISLYDPFSLYTLYPTDHSYQIDQITNGSFYTSNEPDGTVSIYSIDAVIELSFFDQEVKMTDMILFPGMYIRFDPKANLSLKGADLFKIMLILGDDMNSKHTGLEFVNPRVTDGNGEDVFFMFKLPVSTRPLFQMLHVLFVDRIAQVENLKSYASNRSYTAEDINSLIYNPSKKNHYLLDELRSILSRATQSQMDSIDFRNKIQKIHTESKLLVKGNSVTSTLESFLTDTRFALFGKNPNSKFNDIYIETASILGITPSTGKGKFFQYLSDIYSRNIASQKRDPTFSGIDTYTPTADGLKRTLANNEIESKDYFDIALYAYQLLKKAQDGQVFTTESLESRATYDLIDTIFAATEKYIQGLPAADQKLAYQTLVIQFYTPIASSMTRSLYTRYSTYLDKKIYLDKQYLDGDTIKFDPTMRDNIDNSYRILSSMYERITPFFDTDTQPYAMLAFRDSVLRMEGFIKMITEGEYRMYQKSPYIGVDIGGVFAPSVLPDGKLEIYQVGSPQPVVTPDTLDSTTDTIVLPIESETPFMTPDGETLIQ